MVKTAVYVDAGCDTAPGEFDSGEAGVSGPEEELLREAALRGWEKNGGRGRPPHHVIVISLHGPSATPSNTLGGGEPDTAPLRLKPAPQN